MAQPPATNERIVQLLLELKHDVAESKKQEENICPRTRATRKASLAGEAGLGVVGWIGRPASPLLFRRVGSRLNDAAARGVRRLEAEAAY